MTTTTMTMTTRGPLDAMRTTMVSTKVAMAITMATTIMTTKMTTRKRGIYDQVLLLLVCGLVKLTCDR